MLLDDIADVSELEGIGLECKARLSRDNVEGWLKTVAGFANAEGGSFFIGVEDKTGKLIGFSRKDADGERNFFNNQVNEHIFPRPSIRIFFVRYENNGTELFVIRADVPESPVKPVIVKFKNIPSIYMRRDGFTNGATYEEIISMSIRSRNAQFDILDSDLPYRREDFSRLLAFFVGNNPDGELSDKALRSMGFFNTEGMLKNGAVLFSDNYDGGKTNVQCSVFSGLNKGSERIVTINRFSGCLSDSITFMLEFVKQRMNHTFIKHDDFREEVDAYPVRALLEGIVNSVAHRDYFLDGTQIQLDMFLDRLEISSPGSFYQGEKLGKSYDLSKIISKRRNELVCGVLVKCRVMEAAGTGFDKIIQEYERADERHKPFVYSSSDHFTLVLPDLTYAEGIRDDSLPVLEFTPVANGSAHDGKILSFCYGKSRKSSEIAAFLGLSDSSYFRKNLLENLVSQGYLLKSRQSGVSFYTTDKTSVTRK
ncbi:MAG: putative DNA binding domain-containing protein [Treponema sp.]|nr:putative DNA binding domain-containing protein [Treponema sp.]